MSITKDIKRHETETYDILRQRQEEIIDVVFPTDYNFTICIDPYDFDEVIFEQSSIKLKYDFTCYCWSEHNRSPEIVEVKNEEGRSITYRDCIQRLIDVGFDTGCNHCWLEKFGDIDKDGCSEIWMGS